MCFICSMWNPKSAKNEKKFKLNSSINVPSVCKSCAFSEHLAPSTVVQLQMYQTCSPSLKAEPPHTEAVATFPKSHIIECFFNMVAVSKHLGLAFKTQVPANSWEWKKKKKRHLKLNLKMCFSWKLSSAAINQGRHFHAPHFSWFLSEFPPFLSHSTLAPELPTATLAVDHSQQGTAGWPE